MKRILILILFILLGLASRADEFLYLNENSDKEAAKILYEYELKEQNVNKQKALELFDYDLSKVRAVFYDLNSDGEVEIIGYIDALPFMCAQGYELFILKKENNTYKRISNLFFYPQSGLSILKSKTNGFFDLRVHHTKLKFNPEKRTSIKYINTFSSVKYNINEQYYYIPEFFRF